MFKVRNAIILAAGRGKRMGHLKRTPKPLMTYKDKPIIEDLILKLKANQIFDITIVTGYNAKAFEYLVPKFGVKLKYDPKWRKGNSTSSMIAAANNISNTLIIHGDIIMKENYMLREFATATIYGEMNKDLNKPMLIVTQEKHLYNIDYSGREKEGVFFRDVIFVDEQLARHFYPNQENLKKIQGHEFALLSICKKFNVYMNVQPIPTGIIKDFDTADEYLAINPLKSETYVG